MKKNKFFLQPYLLTRKSKSVLPKRSMYSLTFGRLPRFSRS